MKILNEAALKNLKLRNRVFMAPVKTAIADKGGIVNDMLLKYYKKMANGKLGAIIIEPMAVNPLGREHPKQLGIHNDDYIEGISKIINVIHNTGTLAGIHLNHAGRAANPKVINGTPVAPSEITCSTTGATATVLTSEEIEGIINDFGSAAKRAEKAGADFIEIQFGHGYLVAQFYSERTNKRTDAWGGSEEKRLKFAEEVLDKVKKNAPTLPIIIRISSDEFIDGGLNAEKLKPLIKLLEEKEVTAIHVGNGNACETPPWYYSHMAMPETKQIEALKSIRALTEIPLIAAGRMGYLPKIEEVTNIGYDFISLGRPLIADPEFVVKLYENREDEITLCGSCLDGCLRAVKSGQPIHCIVNPSLIEDTAKAETDSRKIMIIGGGPAGISAALNLSKQGNQVALYEKESELGGQFKYVYQLSLKNQMQRILNSLIKQLEKSDVQINKGKEVTAEEIKNFNPDIIIAATGAEQNIPPIKNLDSQNWMTSLEFYGGLKEVKGDRVLIVGAGLIGLETAEMLIEQGKEVVCVDPLPEAAKDMEPILRKIILGKLNNSGKAKIMTNTLVSEFTENEVILKTEDKTESIPKFDTVIIAAGTKPNKHIESLLDDYKGRTIFIGDANKVGNIETAFAAGASVNIE